MKDREFNKNNKCHRGFGLLETIIIIILTSIISGITTGVILYNTYDSEKVTYTEISDDENLKEFLNVYNSVSNKYYKEVDKKEMLEKAINAMIEYLGDDYTTYLSEEESTILSETLSGKYKGIGVSFKNKTIVEVFKNSPAEKAGIKTNDIIFKINGKDCSKLNDTEIVSLIKVNKKNVNLTIKRDSREIEFNLNLDSLNVPAISYKVIEKNIGYLYISTFSNTLQEQVSNALKDLEAQNMDSLIIDVRENAGGYLNAASDVASIFLEKGKTIYTLESNNVVEVYKDKTDEKRNYKIAVLINENSASASEILAAALKESYNATLVGSKSYGKGKVQQTMTLSNGDMVKYTTARWLTPSNKCIDGIGLIPDFEIKLKTKMENSNISYEDTQLKKAIEILSKK